jgi:type VI secretion system protein ImpH
MAAKKRKPSSDLKSLLVEQGHRFSFIQALRLLRLLILKDSGEHLSEIEPFTKIKVRPHLSLNFPTSDIYSIEQDSSNHDRFILTTTFMGLYGSSSPLPTFYTEDLISEQSDGYSAARDLIDLVNSSLYIPLFKVWSKYQLFFNLYEDFDESLVEKLFCLLGVGDYKLNNLDIAPFRLLRYIGLTTFSNRSAEALRSLLSDYLNEPSLRIIQCEPRIVEIDNEQRCFLGKSKCNLGQDCYLGSEVIDRMGKFRVFVNPANINDCRRFLPEGDAYEEMGKLVDFYLDSPLKWDLVIRFDKGKIKTAQLGKSNWGNLGWDTWLIDDSSDSVNSEVTVGHPSCEM